MANDDIEKNLSKNKIVEQSTILKINNMTRVGFENNIYFPHLRNIYDYYLIKR